MDRNVESQYMFATMCVLLSVWWQQLCVVCVVLSGSPSDANVLCCLCTGTSCVYVAVQETPRCVCCCPGVAAVIYVAAQEAPRCVCGSPRDATVCNQVVRVVATDGC